MVNIFSLSTQELKALVEHKEVLEEGKRFPKNFWAEDNGSLNGLHAKCRVLTRYCFENLAGLGVSDLPDYNLMQLKALLVRYKLLGMIQKVFNHNVLEILKNAYPQEFKDRVLKEWMWSKHGVWNDEKAIIEAVESMVAREGIRRIQDIPSLDWKKRLLKYKIYNVLSNFNWSIYALFNFVYPGKFHPADFKYKQKWKAAESLDNAFYHMRKVFKKKKYTSNDILLLGTADFRRFGLAGMLASMFDFSTLKAKEYYLYKTIDNSENREKILKEMAILLRKKEDEAIISRLEKAAEGKVIQNLRSNSTLYGYVKRHAKSRNMSIAKLLSSYGYTYECARRDSSEISRDEIWNLRKQGLTYVQIAEKLGSNPLTITQICIKHFGGDPLIPRPLEDYITVQELMNSHHVDHKTIMKLVEKYGFENHMTIRLRYLKKAEIVPALEKYISESKQHRTMVKRYAR